MGRNNSDFHGITYTHDVGKTGGRIEAIHPEHGTVGHMLLHPLVDGKRKIRNVYVQEDFRRKGVATGMWNYANQQGLKPVHSEDRTDAGDAWAKTVSNRLPKRLGELPPFEEA